MATPGGHFCAPSQAHKSRARARLFLCRDPRRLHRLDVTRLLLALVAAGDLEGDLLAFLQSLETRHVDGGEMGEEILAAAVRSNEAVAFRIVEPLDRTSCHVCAPRIG